jgi:hypothetical protein
MSDTKDGLERPHLVLIYTLGKIEQLKSMGLIEGPDMLTSTGSEAYEALQSEGFEPTTAEIQWAMSVLLNAPTEPEDTE